MTSLATTTPTTVPSQEAASTASSAILDLLGDDSLLHVFRFLGTLNELRDAGNVCRLFNHILFESNAGDTIFRYINRDLDDSYRQTISGRKYWKNLYNIRQSLIMGVNGTTNSAIAPNQLNTVGVLSEEEEAEALCYDNPNYGTSRPSVGYFGFQPLEGCRHICVWGDFHGLSIVPSMNSLTSNFLTNSGSGGELPNAQPNHSSPVRRRFKVRPRLYTNDYQIMDIVHHPKSKYLFLGNASGLVQAVLVERDNSCNGKASKNGGDPGGGGATEYSIVSSCKKHNNEVTSLAIASNQHLVSACVDGLVVLHLDALLDGNVSNTIRLIHTQRLIFSMTSVDISPPNDDTTTTVLCLGGEERILETLFWEKSKFDKKANRRNYTARDWEEATIQPEGNNTNTLNNGGHYRRLFRNGREGHLANLKFLGRVKPRLVVGTSVGDVAVHDLVVSTGSSDIHDNSASCTSIAPNSSNDCNSDYTLSWRYDLTGCCRGGGCVESIDLVGSLLITTGGKDGRVRVWDWNTGTPIASIKIHPGTCFLSYIMSWKC